MLKHPPPHEDSPSTFLAQLFDKGMLPVAASNVRVLDLPCGYGRNSIFLASKYESVVSGDYDPDVLANRWYCGYSNVQPVLLNGHSGLPFESESFDLAVVVHFFASSLVSEVWRVLKPQGLLLLESIGNRGQNWRELPVRLEFEQVLGQLYEPIVYKQNVVRKAPERSTFKLLARKKS